MDRIATSELLDAARIARAFVVQGKFVDHCIYFSIVRALGADKADSNYLADVPPPERGFKTRRIARPKGIRTADPRFMLWGPL